MEAIKEGLGTLFVYGMVGIILIVFVVACLANGKAQRPPDRCWRECDDVRCWQVCEDGYPPTSGAVMSDIVNDRR